MKHCILSYEKLANLLQLDEREKSLDELLLEGANEVVWFMLKREFIASDFTENVVCENGTIILKEWPIQSIESIIDEYGNELESNSYIYDTSDLKKAIDVYTKYNGQTLCVKYRAGYELNDMPSSIIQAVITTFLDKKRECEIRQMNYQQQEKSAIPSSFNEVALLLEPFQPKIL